MSLRVVLYARVSTDMQVEEGLSIPAQLNEMREMAQRQDWTIVSEFADPGISGSSMNRPGLQAMLQAVETGACDVVVVHETSRLSRSIFDTFRIFETLGQHQVGYASVKEPEFDFYTPTGRLFLTMISAINQYYLDLLKQHTAKGKRERARQGLYNASVTPYGYRHSGDAHTPPQIVPEEAKAIRLMFESYAPGNMSFQDVADRLNDAGYQTRSGRRFSKDTIDDMLRNRFYLGDVVYSEGSGTKPPEIYPGQHDAIINRELFDACQQNRRKRWGAARSTQTQFNTYLLNQISVCSLCGRKLRAQATPTNRYYREMSRVRGFVDCPHAQLGIIADVVEPQVEKIMSRLRLPPSWQAEVEELLDRDAEVEALNNRRARLEAEQKRLRDLYVRGYLGEDVSEFERENLRIQRELDALPSGDMAAIKDAAEVLCSLSEVWDEADLLTKRDLLRSVLRQLEIDVQQGRVQSLTPYAPFLPLFRQADHLFESEPGKFIALWSPDEAGEQGPDEVLDPLTDPQTTSESWIIKPFVIDLPDLPPAARISPLLSKFLKNRRKLDRPAQTIVEIPRPGFPALRLDERKWPDLELSRLPRTSPSHRVASDLADASVSLLYTPFVLNGVEQLPAWISEGTRLLDPDGWWVLTELMPVSMPGHWLYRYFPAAFGIACQQNPTPSMLYAALQQGGLEAGISQKTYYQAASIQTALAIARQRHPASLLSRLPDADYEQGLNELQQVREESGAETLLASHFCVAEIIAHRPQENPARKRKRRKPRP